MARCLHGRVLGVALLALAIGCAGRATEDGGPVDAGGVDASADGHGEVDAAADRPQPVEAATDAAAPDTGDPPSCGYLEPSVDGGTRVRVMAANTTSGNASSYEEPAIRIFQGLKPDIVLLQEFKYPRGTLRDLVDTAFGADFAYFVESQPGGIPNGVVSRYPIVQSGEWEDPDAPDRDFAYARIDVPGAADLWAVSVHLRTSDAAARAAEARALVGYIQAAVPAGDYLVVGGDLNTASEGEAAVVELSAVAVVAGPAPADQSGQTRTNAPRSKRYDWLLPNGRLDGRAIPLRIGQSTYCRGLVFDSRVYTPLAEVTPVLADDSAAPNMQHMPVVRDFLLGD